MEEQTRTVKVRATVRNEKELLRPGMFCQVRILLPSTETVLAVPRAAILADEGYHFVFRHMKDDYYVRKVVRKGREFDDKVEILDGLKADEVVIADGAFLLKSDVLREKMGAGCAD
jgi:cobalt-zinc-cadmium efflux system membrane fusion protein